MYNDRDGTGHLLETLQAGVPLTATLPSFIDPDILVQLPSTLVWVTAAVVASSAAWMAATRARTGPFWSAALALLVFGGSGSLLAATMLPGTASDATVIGGRQRLLNAYAGDRLDAFSYETGRRLSDAELFDRAALEARLDPTAAPADASQLVGPFDLPPGRYDLLVWFTEQQVHDGEVFLSYDRTGGVIARGDGRVTNPAVVPFELPVGLPALRVGATSVELARMVSGIAVSPRGLVPRRQRHDVGRIRSVKSVGERLGAYLFFLDQNTYVEPEHNWVRGGDASRMLVSPGPAARMRVVVRNGGADNRITVTVGNLSETFAVRAWETRELAVSVADGEALLPVRVATEDGFVPAEVEPGSTDTRRLGCTVTVLLE